MAWRTGSALMATAFLAVAWAAPTTTLADPGQAGRIAGGIGAQGFDPSASYRTATQALGLQDARTSGELGGEVGIQVKQQQQRTFRCRDGARITAGGVRVSIESCEQSQNGSLSTLSVSVCDALTQGIGCTDERYTAAQQVPAGGEATFTGGLLTGTYRVSADCSSNECVMTMHQLHGDAWGGSNMRQDASQRVSSTDGHLVDSITGVRNNPVFESGESFANNRAHCLGGQFNQLFTEGDIPVSCLPDDPRTIDFLDLEGGGQCEPDVITTETCSVDIPTRIVTCEPESRTCDVQRETEEFTCTRRLQVEHVGFEACTPGHVVYQWQPFSNLRRRFVCQSCHHPYNCLVYQFNQNSAGWQSSFRFEYSRNLGWHHPELMPGAPSGYYIRQSCSNQRCHIDYRRTQNDSTERYSYDEASPIFQDSVTENCEPFEQRRPEIN